MFYIFDFGTYQLKVPALNLKAKNFKVKGGYKKRFLPVIQPKIK